MVHRPESARPVERDGIEDTGAFTVEVSVVAVEESELTVAVSTGVLDRPSATHVNAIGTPETPVTETDSTQ